jgi:hypothetical protein
METDKQKTMRHLSEDRDFLVWHHPIMISLIPSGLEFSQYATGLFLVFLQDIRANLPENFIIRAKC